MDGDMQKFPHEWLKEKLGSLYEVPHTVSAEAIETLTKLKEINLESDNDADQIIMYIEKLTKEIKSEDEKIQSVLKKLGLSVSDLEEKSKDALEDLVAYQMKYNLRDTSKTTMLLDRVERMQKEAEEARSSACLKREKERLNFMTERLQNATEELEIQRTKEEQHLDILLKEVDKKKTESTEMSSEIEKCKSELHELQMQLNALNVTDRPVHRRVLDKLKNVDMMKKQIVECQTQLKKYKGLPPDFFEARKKLADMHNKLREVEKEVLDKILGKSNCTMPSPFPSPH
ncbi:chromosome partition protein Smc-like isoform X1 [Schistocerca cancellata]|uniref:chromosome partition protein Smc-like isoform X1 n=2 Tax=Schistocerca cancellata TaxID=274614 RepID=UPI0021183CFD|nr:chromosome partition protein Smc-like isoform X1 [Schistocerca cancellata]